jgi:hypothetical protein
MEEKVKIEKNKVNALGIQIHSSSRISTIQYIKFLVGTNNAA